MIGDALSIVRGMAVSRNLDISASIDPALPGCLLGDRARIQQILLNLLNNAVKFTLRGSVTLNVRLEKADAARARLRLSVVDTGIGITRSKQDRLFKRFSQADSSVSRELGGSGLGLAICKRLVELMGGEIGVFSEEGRGSNFWFIVTLPRATMPAFAPATVRKADRSAPTGHLLLVEDEVNQVLARALLEAVGHRVDVVGSGEEALKRLRGGSRYDLVSHGRADAGHGRHRRDQSDPQDAVRREAADHRDNGQRADRAGAQLQGSRHGRSCRQADRPQRSQGHARSLADRRWSGVNGQPSRARRGDLRGDRGAARPANSLSILQKLAVELEARFVPALIDAKGRERFLRDAHVITSVAGMLGFKDLSGCCANLLALHRTTRPASR